MRTLAGTLTKIVDVSIETALSENSNEHYAPREHHDGDANPPDKSQGLGVEKQQPI